MPQIRKCTLYFLLLFLLTAIGPAALAQKTVVRGTVTDQHNGEPVAFAKVIIRGKQIGCIADAYGKYSIDIPNGIDTLSLVVKFLGYEEKVIFIDLKRQKGNEHVYDVALSEPNCCPEPIVIIHAWKSRAGISGEMDELNPLLLASGGNVSTEQALNAVPGVRFDSRGSGGSRRLSIRGSAIRSPFGVQNIRAYVDGLPLSNPDGSTPIELLDVSTIGEMAVEKGPRGDEYGPGNNGVLLVGPSLDAVQGKWGGMLEHMTGSYGYQRLIAASGLKTDRAKVAVRYIGQRYNGYRQQEGNRKNALYLNSELRMQKNESYHRLRFSGWHYQGRWELPGGLTEAEVEENPRQALPFSVFAKAAVNRQHSRLNLGYELRFRKSMLTAGVYGNYSTKVNPYGTSPLFQGYKDEKAKGTGARVEASSWLGHKLPIQVRVGAEYQVESNHALEFNNELGEPGTVFKSALRIVSEQAQAYAGLRLVKEGGSFNRQQLDLNSGMGQVKYTTFLLPPLSSPGQSEQAVYGTAFMPSLRYMYLRDTYAPYIKVRARLSTGYSPPSREELIQDRGVFWPGLRHERSQSAELSPAIYLFRRRLLAEIAAYSTQVRNALVNQQEIGRNVYTNAASLRQNGLEAFLRFIHRWNNGRSKIHAEVGAALQDYRYASFIKDSTDLGGNFLPGVSRITFNALLASEFARFSAQISSRYQGRSPANDENTVWQPGYFLLNAQVSTLIGFNNGPKLQNAEEASLQFRVLCGMNNILNTQYTNFLALNAFGGRYWNPAPGRNIFAGLQIRF